MRFIKDLGMGVMTVLMLSVIVMISVFVLDWSFGFNWEDFWLIVKLDLFWGLCLGVILNLSRG